MTTEHIEPPTAAAPHRPDYATAKGPGRWITRRTVLLAGLVVILLLISTGFWARGRGYKVALLRRLYPDHPTYMTKPTVLGVRPTDREGGVMPDAFIAADVRLPNPGKVIDRASLEGAVQLLKGNAREKVPAMVNTSGGGDSIVLRPLQPLELNALYTFEVLPALRDTGGAPFEHYRSTFSTAAGTVYSDFPAAAEKVSQPATFGQWYTGVTFGPDGRLYASTLAGQIYRFDVAADGMLSSPKIISTVLASNQGPRLVTGITFDPKSTAENPVAYVAHGTFPFDRVPTGQPQQSRAGTPHQTGKKAIPDWGGKVSRLSGVSLERYEDLIVGLPRARMDHTTGQISFGPDGGMYFSQASNTAMGAPDAEWGFRPERMLTACIMRLDLPKLARHALPLNVQTEDGGTYDPFADDAPLTLFATGTRNCYDLLWHSNGCFYATLNGSARGGNTPGTDGKPTGRRFDHATSGAYNGGAVAGLEGVGTQDDYLLRIEQGGYFGHPNPTRNEFVMNGGNPTAGADPCEVAEYPVGTQPDRNWRRPAFVFSKNLSPCGITEYSGTAFPALKNKVLVVRFSGGKDVIALTPGDDGDISESVTGIEGFTGFYDPVDLCVAPKTGYIYVAEHTGQRLTLLRPQGEQMSHRAIVKDTSAQADPAIQQPVAKTSD